MEQLRSIVHEIHRGDRAAGLDAFVVTTQSDDLRTFAKLSTYAGLVLGSWLEEKLGPDPIDRELIALAASADTSFLKTEAMEWLGEDFLLRTFRALMGRESVTGPEEIVRFTIGCVFALSTLVDHPLADMTNRRARVAADLKLLRPMNQHTQRFFG